MIKRLIPFLLFACGAANAQGYIAEVAPSATSVLLPCVSLRATDDTPAGSTLKSGITASTAGLSISVKADNAATWTDYTQAGSTINAKSSAIGTWETPDANDVHFAEAESEGCYQIDLANSTWSVSGAKYVQIKIWDSSSPTFADKLVTVNQNVITGAELVDDIWDEPCAGHTTGDTLGDQVCDQFDTLVTNVGTLPADVWDTQVEDAGTGYTGRCIMGALFAVLAGEWSSVGNVATYKEPAGTTSRVVGSYSSGGRDTITITCPTAP